MMWWTAHFEAQWIVSLLPSQSSTTFETVLDLVDANLVARDPLPLITVARSDADAPAAWLPYLADERSVDEFSGAWPEARQRAVVRESLPIHQRKGSRPAVDRIMTAMGYSTQIVEWFEVDPPRQANTFRLVVSIDPDREWFSADMLALIRAANKAKNLHTKLEAMEPQRRIGPAAINIGGLPRSSRTLRIGSLPKVTTIQIPAAVFVGTVVRKVQTIRIQPRI